MSTVNINLETDLKINPKNRKICENEFLSWYNKVERAIAILEKYNNTKSDFIALYNTLYKLSDAPTTSKELSCNMITYLRYLQRTEFFDLNIGKVPKVTIHMDSETRAIVKADQKELYSLWEEIKNFDNNETVGVIATKAVKPLISAVELNKFHES